MQIESIDWNEETIIHIARHGVDPDEVEQVCFSADPLIVKTKYNRYVAMGQTTSGRYLTIVFQYLGRHRAQIITARAMADTERKFYQRRR